jgi:hypothetical protein
VGQLNAGPDVRKTVGKWLASGLSEDKLKAAMQQPDFQQTFTFIRLAVADKGLYQQHVILDWMMQTSICPPIKPKPLRVALN